MQTIFLVDGFPRNDDNLSGWCRFMTPYLEDDSNISREGPFSSLWGVLVYHCPLSVLEDRIMERAKESGRSDDNLKSIQKRFATFQQETQPIIEKLRQASEFTIDDDRDMNWKVIDIQGDRPLDDVWAETRAVFDGLIQNDVLSNF